VTDKPESDPIPQVAKSWHVAAYPFLAFTVATTCLLTIVDGAVPQLQMVILGGHMITNALTKAALVTCLALGAFLRPRLSTFGVPMMTWKIVLGFLVFEIWHLFANCHIGPVEILQSYNRNYLILLVGPAALAFRHAVPERWLIRFTVALFLLSMLIGMLQYFTNSPILYTVSAEANFEVNSWIFYDSVRAFSLFNSSLNFSIFCAFCGSLGVALSRQFPRRGLLLAFLAALTCYITLTRNGYLIFLCAVSCSAIITFGKRPSRGSALPWVYFLLGTVTMFHGLFSFEREPGEAGLASAASLIDRLAEWTYFSRLFLNAPLSQKLFGMGLAQQDRFVYTLPAPIDNLAIAIIVHLGIVGAILLTLMMAEMWRYLRRRAVSQPQSFVIASASLWSTFACAGIFNIMSVPLGAVFTLALICGPGEKVEAATLDDRTGKQPAAP